MRRLRTLQRSVSSLAEALDACSAEKASAPLSYMNKIVMLQSGSEKDIGVDKLVPWKRYPILNDDATDTISLLDVYLDLGDVERAKNSLLRLTNLIPSYSHNVVTLNNRYLHLLVGKTPTKTSINEALDWLEIMENLSIKPNLESYSIILNGASKLEGSIGEECIRFAVESIQERGAHLGKILGSSDFVINCSKIIQVCRLTVEDLGDEYRYLLDTSKPFTPNFAIQKESVDILPTSASGLSFLKQTLNAQVDGISALGNFNIPDQQRQFALESASIKTSIDRWAKEYTEAKERGLAAPKSLNPLIYEWHLELLRYVQAERELCEQILKDGTSDVDPKNASRLTKSEVFDDISSRRVYAPFFLTLPNERWSAIILLELMSLFSALQKDTCVPVYSLTAAIGEAAEQEYVANLIKKDSEFQTSQWNLAFKSERAFQMKLSTLRKRNHQTDNGEIAMSSWTARWPKDVKTRLGALAVSLLLYCAKVDTHIKDRSTDKMCKIRAPAFIHTYKYNKGRKLGVIKCHDRVANKMLTEPLNTNIDTRLQPMVCVPKPWTSVRDGGYYFTKVDVVKVQQSNEQIPYIAEAASRGFMDDFFAALNVLGKTSWKVNRKILNVVLEVWNTGDSFLEIPGVSAEVDFPSIESTSDPELRNAIKKKRRELYIKKASDHSVRCDLNYKIEIAKAFINERIYFPHNVDFRGRAYPMSPHFNHMGNDLSRSLLLFYETKPLGKRGLDWLKTHLAGLQGLDKVSYEDRLKFTNDHMHEVFDSAKNPLNGNMWWKGADDPWQSLATCFEIVEALESGNPETFESCLPVHQDGSCNGLQHYAALGCDLAGAQAVNLMPSDKPQDVYARVADIVNTLIGEDLKQEGCSKFAKMLHNKINRKVVKTTVMTSVYGVTFIGASRQIEEGLIDVKIVPNDDDLHLAAIYIAKKTFEAMGSMFESATSIQSWLSNCARRICHAKDPRDPKNAKVATVIWTTPLGLPIVHPYRKEKSLSIRTHLQAISIGVRSAFRESNAGKQILAFAPNFVHSLDATHMMLSALACEKENLTFAAVHDSYWTHACDIERMSRILREEFVSLHSSDILGNLKKEFESRYGSLHWEQSLKTKAKNTAKIVRPNFINDNESNELLNEALGKKKEEKEKWVPMEFLPVPKKGEFDIHKVLDSKYFFC